MITAIDLDYRHSGTDLKDILSTVTPIQDDSRKMLLEPFPSTKDLVTFAGKAYSDYDYELCDGLPDGWEMLTTGRGGLNGYFGCAYWNSSLQQVVLAHRGTDLWNLGAVYTDINGVWQTKYTDYMFSAVTLADEIKRAILEVNMQDGVRFTLTITGHSLGAWLAQVTAITIKYLKRQDDGFAQVSNIDEGLHAHTVAFDSPGVQDMVIKIQRDYGRYGSTPFSMFRNLDITNFFMAVNLVNVTGFHAGSMYQVASNLVCTSGFKHMFSNLSTHSIKNFAEAFRAGDGKLFLVKNWPQGWVKRTLVHVLDKVLRTHRPETGADQLVHYEVGEEDPGISAELNCFSELQLDLIKLIFTLRKNAIRDSNIENFFAAKSLSLEELFPIFTISRKENVVTFNCRQHLEKFVNNIKNALRWFPWQLQDAMEEQRKLSTSSLLLDMASHECLDSVPACEDTLGLREFTENSVRVLYVQAADCGLEMARISNVLFQLDNAYADVNRCIFLDWTGLQKLDKYLKIEDLPLTNDHLLVVNFGFVTDKVHPILKKVFLNLNKYREKKVVIVSSINPALYDFVNTFEPELAVRCLPLSAQECLEFGILDLKDKSRQELFAREFILLGEQVMSLNALLGENCQSSVSIDNVLKPFLKDVLMDESFILNVPNNLLKFVKSDVMYSKIYREVAPATLTELLREETYSLFVSRGAREVFAPQLQEVPEAAERVAEIAGSSEEDFRQACYENLSVQSAYWLAATDGRLSLKQIYNSSFYLFREFHDQSVVDLDKLVQKRNDADLFVFGGVDNKEKLMRCLHASPEVEKVFCANIKFKIQESGENSEGNDRCVNRHTLNVVMEGEGYQLVWQDSQGALDGLLPCLRTNSRLLSEEALCVRKAVIISDQPGMGKSTTLASLSRHLVHSWLLMMDLRDRSVDIMSLPAQMSVESVGRFLAGAESEPATRGLLRFCLQNQRSRQIHVLLDGFDEIRDEGAIEKVLKLCQFLKNETTAKIIVTTRDNYRDVLINRLSTVTTIFEEISERDQLNFLVNFWSSHAALGTGSCRRRSDERLRLFAQHLYEAAHKKLGGDIIRLIGIPLQMTILAQAFIQQAEQFSRNAESIPNIAGINNVYNLYKKFTGAKRDIYLTEKILMGNMIGGFDNMLYEKITENHCILAFQILDVKFAMKYLQVITSEDEFKEMNRFGLTQWNRETNCDFIHRTFAEYFCSHLLVLWLRQENFRFKYLPIEEWFLCKLLTNQEFNVVRKFLDEHLTENPLPADSKLLYNYMSNRWFEDDDSFRDKDGQTALHLAVKENNPNIIDILLGGLAMEQTRVAFLSFLVARDYEGYTALKRGLEILYPRNYRYIPESELPINDNNENSSKEDIVKRIMHNVSHLPYDLKFKHLISTLLKGQVFQNEFKLLLKCAHNAEDREDIQSALDRIEVLVNYLSFYFIDLVKINNTFSVREFISNELENDVEREFLPFARKDFQSAIEIASGAGNLELVKLFTGGSRDVLKSRHGFGMTPLHCAVTGGHIDVVDYLLDQGARLDVVDSYGKSALSCASENGQLLIVKRLLERGADPNYSGADGRTALHLAAERRHLIVVKHLLISGADVNSMDVSGKSALHYVAKECGSIAIVKHLLNCGADVDLKENSGRTALSCAAEAFPEVIQHLIKCGADVNTRDHHGKTPLCYAIEKRNTDVVDCFLDYGADVNLKELTGRNALSFAAGTGFIEIFQKILKSYGGDINTSDQDGKSPLIYAVLTRRIDVVKYIVESGADINRSDRDGKTPLIYAVLNKDIGVVKYLVESGADINKSDQDGKTPLIYAVLERTDEAVKYLIESGAEINARGQDGNTPLNNAAVTNNDVILEHLHHYPTSHLKNTRLLKNINEYEARMLSIINKFSK